MGKRRNGGERVGLDARGRVEKESTSTGSDGKWVKWMWRTRPRPRVAGVPYPPLAYMRVACIGRGLIAFNTHLLGAGALASLEIEF